MGNRANRGPFPFRNGGVPKPVSTRPGTPQFLDNDVVLTVKIEIDKAGSMKVTTNPTPHPLSLIKLFSGLIQGQTDYLLMQQSMIIDPNNPRGKPPNDGTESGGETGESETPDDNRGNPPPTN